MGVDFTPWSGSIHSNSLALSGLLYYDNARLTDKHYIKNVYVWDRSTSEFTNKGTHFMYVVGEVEIGDYLTTSPVYGAAIKCENKELAFAQVVENRLPSQDVVFPVVGGVRATFR